jgi:hypothetical protein
MGNQQAQPIASALARNPPAITRPAPPPPPESLYDVSEARLKREIDAACETGADEFINIAVEPARRGEFGPGYRQCLMHSLQRHCAARGHKFCWKVGGSPMADYDCWRCELGAPYEHHTGASSMVLQDSFDTSHLDYRVFFRGSALGARAGSGFADNYDHYRDYPACRDDGKFGMHFHGESDVNM